MKIVLSTIGRFHIFPLARELEAVNCLTQIYSGFPWSKLAREGVSRKYVRTFPYIRPFLLGARVLPFKIPPRILDRLHQISVVTLDHYVARTLPDADVFVGHEGVGLLSGQEAQRRGMVYVCDRGCAHMAWRENLLNEENARFGLPPRKRPLTYDREISEYSLADIIVVASKMAQRSFIESGIPVEKVKVVPYGVDLERFQKVADPSPEYFDILFVGGLSLRKGAADLLAAFHAAKIPNKRLTIIGQIDPFIEKTLTRQLSESNIRRLGHVPHHKLKDFMSRAHVLAMPSIEDGFGMVVAEAMACGCPVIVSENVGAADIVSDGVNGFIVSIRSPEIITQRLEALSAAPELQRMMGQSAKLSVEKLGGWRSYGEEMISIYEVALGKSEAAI